MRLHFLTAFVATLLIGLVSGQFPFGNGFQSSSFASSGSGVQVSAGVNNFQSYNQEPPTNFNPNGRNGFAGSEAQANSGGGVAINPVNPSNLFQQFSRPNVPVNPLSAPPVNAAASSSSFQQFSNVNPPPNPLGMPPINAAAASSYQQFQRSNAPGNSVPPVNSAYANSFQQFPNANVPVNTMSMPSVNSAVSSNAFQGFPNGNIPVGAINSAVHPGGFQNNPFPIAPDLPIIKPPVQPFSVMSSNKGQTGNGANYPPPQIANPSNAFSSSHSSSSVSSGIPNDYPKFPFPKGFLDQLIASLGASKSQSTSEDASKTMAASPKISNNGNNKEMAKARKKNGNKKRNKKKSKARRKAESKANVNVNSKSKRMEPATSKQDITKIDSADEIKATEIASDILGKSSAPFVTSSIAPITFKDSTAEFKSKTSIPSIEITSIQDEEAKSKEAATSLTTQDILIANSEITDFGKAIDSSVTKSTGKEEMSSITDTKTSVNVMSIESPKKPSAKSQKLQKKSKKNKKNKNKKNKLSTSNHETTRKSIAKSSTSYSSSIQVPEVQRETTNAVDITTEAIDVTMTTAGTKANIMDSMVTKDFASSVASKQEEILKVTESSFESDAQTSKSEEKQNKSMDTQTNPTGSTRKNDEKSSSNKAAQSPKKKKSNKARRRKNNSKKNNTSSKKRKSAQVQETSGPKNDTSNINVTESDSYTPTPSGATSSVQSQSIPEKKIISSDLVSDFVTDETTEVFSTDFTNTDNEASRSETISNKAMSSTIKTDSESNESKVADDSVTSTSISNSEISDKSTTTFENQGLPNDYPKFSFPKGFLDELFKSLGADKKSKSTEEVTSESTSAINESTNKGNKKTKPKPRRKHGPKNRNRKRKSKVDSKNIENSKSDLDSYSVGKAMAISTASSESKLDNTTSGVIEAGEMTATAKGSNIVDSVSVTSSSNVQKETADSIDTTAVTTVQAVVTNLEHDDIDSDTSKTKIPKSTEENEAKIITAASTGVSVSVTESPKKTNVKATKPKRKPKSNSKNKKNRKTKLSTSKYETSQKSITKISTSSSSGIQTEITQSKTTNSMDHETGRNYHTTTAESVTTTEMYSVSPNDKRSSATATYKEEKTVTDTSNNKSDFITPKIEEKQPMDSKISETSKVGNKLRLSTAVPRKNRNRVRQRNNNRRKSSIPTLKTTTPLQERSSSLNVGKINRNQEKESEFVPTLSLTTPTTTSYKSTDRTTDKKITPEMKTTSDVQGMSSLSTETATFKREIDESDDASKKETELDVSSKTTMGLQNKDSDLISDSMIKTTQKMSEMDIETTAEIENEDKEVSSKSSRKKHSGKTKTTKRKSKSKRKGKMKKELNSKKNKNEKAKTKTDTFLDIDKPTTKAQTVTISSEHATAFAIDQSLLSATSGDFTLRDPNLVNSEKASKQNETTTMSIPFTDQNILLATVSNKSVIRASNPRKKPKSNHRKLKRKPTKSNSKVIQMPLGFSKNSSLSNSQLENIRNRAAFLMDTITTTNDQVILSTTNIKPKNSDSDVTSYPDTTTETIELTTSCEKKAVSDNIAKKSSKRAKKSQHKKRRKPKRKSDIKYPLKKVAFADTATKYSTSDTDKQTTNAEETITYSVSKFKQNPTEVNTKIIETTTMITVSSDFANDSDSKTLPKSSETDESTTKNSTTNPNVSSIRLSKSLFRKFRKRKNRIQRKNGNSTLLRKKSEPPNQIVYFISSANEANTEVTEQSDLPTESSALSTTGKDSKIMRASTKTYDNSFPGRKTIEIMKRIKKKHRRRKFPFRAKSEFVKKHNSSSTMSGSIPNPEDTISSNYSILSTSDNTQEASTTSYVPVTITASEEAKTTTMIPIVKNAKAKVFNSKMSRKKHHHERENNIHNKLRRRHRVWKVKKKLPKRKNSRGHIIQPAVDIYSEDLDSVPTTKGVIAEADAFIPTSDITTETVEETSDSLDTCDDDEEWWDCKPQNHNTCANFARAESRIDFECESGCFCRDGLIMDNDGSCVEMFDCSEPICDETEEATDCLNTCNTCEADCHSCTITMCIQGCDCLDGYKRDANGTCIHASKCPACTSPSPISSSTE